MATADTAVLIERLRRANRRWKRLALGSLALLVVVLVGAAVTIVAQANRSAAALRAADEARRAEQEARQEAERQRGEAEGARDQVQRLMYLRDVELAAREWERVGSKR